MYLGIWLRVLGAILSGTSDVPGRSWPLADGDLERLGPRDLMFLTKDQSGSLSQLWPLKRADPKSAKLPSPRESPIVNSWIVIQWRNQPVSNSYGRPVMTLYKTSHVKWLIVVRTPLNSPGFVLISSKDSWLMLVTRRYAQRGVT